MKGQSHMGRWKVSMRSANGSPSTLFQWSQNIVRENHRVSKKKASKSADVPRKFILPTKFPAPWMIKIAEGPKSQETQSKAEF